MFLAVAEPSSSPCLLAVEPEDLIANDVIAALRCAAPHAVGIAFIKVAPIRGQCLGLCRHAHHVFASLRSLLQGIARQLRRMSGIPFRLGASPRGQAGKSCVRSDSGSRTFPKLGNPSVRTNRRMLRRQTGFVLITRRGLPWIGLNPLHRESMNVQWRVCGCNGLCRRRYGAKQYVSQWTR